MNKPEPTDGASEQVPANVAQEPFIGWLQGTVTILGDLTQPIDVEWDALKDQD